MPAAARLDDAADKRNGSKGIADKPNHSDHAFTIGLGVGDRRVGQGGPRVPGPACVSSANHDPESEFSTKETVACETPAAAATSRIAGPDFDRVPAMDNSSYLLLLGLFA
jgi:hypothetical protein